MANRQELCKACSDKSNNLFYPFPSHRSAWQAIETLVLGKQALDNISRNPLTSVPTGSVSDIYMTLDQFDYSVDAKNGCCRGRTKSMISWNGFPQIL